MAGVLGTQFSAFRLPRSSTLMQKLFFGFPAQIAIAFLLFSGVGFSATENDPTRKGNSFSTLGDAPVYPPRPCEACPNITGPDTAWPAGRLSSFRWQRAQHSRTRFGHVSRGCSHFDSLTPAVLSSLSSELARSPQSLHVHLVFDPTLWYLALPDRGYGTIATHDSALLCPLDT